MPDPVIPQGNPAPGTAAGGAAGGETLTPEQRIEKLEGLLTTFTTNFASVQKQLNHVAAQNRVAGKPATETTPTEAQNVTLESLKSELNARDQRIKEKAIRTEIRAFAKNNSIAPEAIPILEAFVEKQYGKKLTTNENDEVVFEDELGDVQPFEVLGKKILAGAGGQTFLQPVETPGSVGQRTKQGVTFGGSGGKPLSEWTPTDYQKNPAAGAEAIRNAILADRQGRTTRT